MSIGVPIKILHESIGHIVTLETVLGEVFRGKLVDCEDNMNCIMGNITVTFRNGRTTQLEQAYIRGSKIRFLILPEMIKNTPMFKSVKSKLQVPRPKVNVMRYHNNATAVTRAKMLAKELEESEKFGGGRGVASERGGGRGAIGRG